MHDKVDKKTFTLTMLGTDTVFTHTLKTKKKIPLKIGDRVREYYPKGETLSIISTLINTSEQPKIDPLQLAPYQSNEVVVVNGPNTEGRNVGEKIGIGLGIALNALVRGQTELNDIAHSRGGVGSILIAHELNAIKDAIGSCESFDQLIKEITRQQTNRQHAKPYNNTPDITQSLLTQLPKDAESQEQWFKSLKSNIPNASMNLFIIDPVPGDCWPVTWFDQRFFTLPPIVKYAEFVYYENERSDWGFTPIYPEATNPEQVVIRNTLPGHHGTGSAGTNASQQNLVVSPDGTKSTHVQKLMLFKLLRFLTSHGVEFKDAQIIFQEHTALGKKYIYTLEKIQDVIDVTKLDFPTIFRKLYDKIYENRKAYEAFNSTHYTFMGVAPQRKLLRTDHKYGLLTEVFPKNTGYVNEEHSTLMKEYFFKILQVDSHEDNTLAALINSAKTVLSKNIKKISNLSSSLIENSIPRSILDNETARKDVLNSFGALIQRVSHQFLINEWSSEQKQQEKLEFFTAIIQIFEEFNELSKIDNQTIKQFVAELIALGLNGITQTVGQLHSNMEEEFKRLQATTDENLKNFFNTLLVQVNKDERYSGSQIHPEIIRIFESHEFAQLANFPVHIKIKHICEKLKENLPKGETDGNLVDSLSARFEELYSSSLDEYEKLYQQMNIFINDIAALKRVFPTEEAVFNKHELALYKKTGALIDSAAQKFYRDRPNNLPNLAEKDSFKELVERHAINQYQVVDRVKQQKSDLENEKRRMEIRIREMEQQIREKDQQGEVLNASLEQERSKKSEYQKALNDIKEAEYLQLINKKLIPLTKEYLASLESQLSESQELESDEETKQEDAKINIKTEKLKILLTILQNEDLRPHPKDRLHKFYKTLDKFEGDLTKHRNEDWIRYCQNALIAAGILLSVIIPGLAVLAVYRYGDYSSTKSFFFWQSSGQNVVSKMNHYRKNLDIPFQEELNDDEEQNDENKYQKELTF